MQQMDLFDETLQKKINRMEKWINRLQREVWFLKEVYSLANSASRDTVNEKDQQIDLFGT